MSSDPCIHPHCECLDYCEAQDPFSKTPVRKKKQMNTEHIAKIAHEINRAYCAAIGDPTQDTWDKVPAWQRESYRMGVDLHLMGDFGPEASHIAWAQHKIEDGWRYGEHKDAEAKTHPCLVPFEELPKEQQAKDYLFHAVVHALKEHLE